MHPLENYKQSLNNMALSNGDLGFYFPKISNLSNENFLEERKNIEQILGKKLPEDYWQSFLIMNGNNLSSVYLSSIQDLIKDNRQFVKKYRRQDLPYVILGHDVSLFYFLNLKDDQFGKIEIDEIVYGEFGSNISTDYKVFLNDVLEPYLDNTIANIEENEEN